MKPELRDGGTITAYCPDCEGRTNFTPVGAKIEIEGRFGHFNSTYHQLWYSLHQCVGCKRGGLSAIFTNGGYQSAYLRFFYPFFRETLALPSSVPKDIEAEFREAERCASFGANRAASAMFRSALEKTLKANGYVRQGGKLRDLESKIDEAANDGIITDARRRRAHEEVRVLGNDVLHDEWREVKDEEVELAHLYTQRILEDFYDDRETVVKKLIELGRLTKKDGDNETSSSITDTGYDDDGRGASHP